MCKSGKAKLRCSVLWLIIACLFAGLIMYWLPSYLQHLADEKIADVYVPKEGTAAWTDFLFNDEPDDPKEYDFFWMFNLTNPDEFLQGAAPHVNQVGPFVYWRHERKQFVDTSVSGELSYNLQKFYEPVLEPLQFTNADGSITTWHPVDPSTEITFLSPVPFAVAGTFAANPQKEELLAIARGVCMDVFKIDTDTHPLECIDVFLVTLGYKGGMAAAIAEDGDPLKGLIRTQSASAWLAVQQDKAPHYHILKIMNEYFRKLKNDQWGFLYNQSAANLNFTRQYTRQTTVSFDRSQLVNALTYRKYQGNTYIQDRNTTMTTGQNYSIFDYQRMFVGWGETIDFRTGSYRDPRATHPGVDRDEQFTFWLRLGGRPINIVYHEDVSIKGVKAYRYIVPSSDFALNDYNKKMKFVSIDGFLDEVEWQNFAPVQVSWPHFYLFPELRKKYGIPGLPNATKQDLTYIDIEPTTGVAINAAEQIQVNLNIPRYNWTAMNISASFGDIVIPTLINSDRLQLTNAQASRLRTLQKLPEYKIYIHIGGGVLTAFSLLLCVTFYAKYRSSPPEPFEETPLLSSAR